MPAQVFGSGATATQLYLAFNGVAPSNPIYKNWVDVIDTSGESALALQLGQATANIDSATLAASVLANLGVSAATTNAEAFAALSTAVVQLFESYPAASRGQIVLNMTKLLTGLEGNATYGTAAANFNSTTLSAYTYASNTANTTPGTQSTGSTFTLTTSAEQITGTSGNDTFNGSNTTLLLDVLNGGAGTDTLNYSDAAGGKDLNALGLSMSSIETVNVRSVGAAAATTTSFSDVGDLNILQGTTATVVAGASTNVSVSGASDAITVDGGKDVTVTDSTADKNITIGDTTVNAGKISVTDTNVGAADVKVDGGTDVTLALTGSTGGGKVITVGNGGAATDLPSGAVVVTSAYKAAAGTDASLNSITVKGGSTVGIAQTAVSGFAATDTTGATVTQGDVTVVGGTTTTSVSVSQTASKAEAPFVAAVAGSSETASVKFGALKSGDKLTLDADAGGDVDATELTFTAAKDLTAAEVAAAFASLVNLDTQGGAAVSSGTFTGAASLWTSAAASGDTVVFTSTKAPATAGTDVANLAFVLTNTSGTSVAPVVTTTNGVNKVVSVPGVLGVLNGTVLIDDNATAASITTVSVDGYGGTSKIGDTTTLSKLTTLSLANSGSTGAAGETDATMSVDAAGVASLNLTVNAIKGNVSLDGAADSALKTLNLTVTGANSAFALTAAAVETLAISGDKSADLSTGTFTALKTITVSGSAGATFDVDEADTLTSVNTSATTGKVTATIDGAQATYTGGAGVDVVTLATSTALTKAIDLGAGDDTLSFGALAVTGSTAALNGGAGTDTLKMTVAAADGLDGAPVSFYTGFERLTLSNAYGDDDNTLDTLTLDLANLGFTNYVTTAGTVADTATAANSDVLVLNKMASGGTVVLTAAGLVQVNVADAATGASDVLNAVLSSTGNLSAGTLTAANVESINLSTVDTETGASPTKNVDTLTLTADKAATVNLSGSADLTLTLTGSTKVATINASGMTGGLTVTSLNTTDATTITGGSGNDKLTAATGTTADVLLGGAGNDTLTVNAGMDTLTGGAGNDTFVIGTASQNVNAYATITDFAAGDVIQFTGADSFQAAKVALGDTAVFQDYANAAMNAIGANDVAWFQFGGNTYAVMDAGADSTSFTNSQDFIVKLTGLVDLTNASFNATSGTISL